jgi:hypothetical protein
LAGAAPYNIAIADNQPEGGMAETSDGKIFLGMLWMIVISLLLIWLPALGPLIAGIVGGKVAGGVGNGFAAALLPGVLLAAGLFLFGTFFTGLPMMGALIASSGMLLYLLYIPMLLIGALIGGLLA